MISRVSWVSGNTFATVSVGLAFDSCTSQCKKIVVHDRPSQGVTTDRTHLLGNAKIKYCFTTTTTIYGPKHPMLPRYTKRQRHFKTVITYLSWLIGESVVKHNAFMFPFLVSQTSTYSVYHQWLML